VAVTGSEPGRSQRRSRNGFAPFSLVPVLGRRGWAPVEIGEDCTRRSERSPVIPGIPWRSLEAALWAFHDADSFEEAVLRAVNLGDDADTTGAISGQLAGAFWGESNIPEPLRSGLARMDMIEEALMGVPSA
jgi:hypothetical protein